MIENNQLCLASAQAIGASVFSIKAGDIHQGKVPVILKLAREIVKAGLLSSISITSHPELLALKPRSMELKKFSRIPPEELLLMWVNHHMSAGAGASSSSAAAASGVTGPEVANFADALADGRAIGILVAKLFADRLAASSSTEAKALAADPVSFLDSATSDAARCTAVVAALAAVALVPFASVESLTSSATSANLLTLAMLFTLNTGLEVTSGQEEEMKKITITDVEGTREERMFRLWIMSLGIEKEVRELDEDFKDGLAMLQIEDAIEPGIVKWAKVNTTRLNAFKLVENCNYGVSLAKSLKCVVVGIDGQDFARGNRKLTLAILWQLMRFNVLNIIRNLKFEGREVSDDDVLAWANDRVAAAGKSSSIRSFKDRTLSTSHFLIDLLYAIKPRAVDYSLVTPGESDEDAMLNAKYAIGVARKLGAQVFLVWEDICEVNERMILTFFGNLMSLAG